MIGTSTRTRRWLLHQQRLLDVQCRDGDGKGKASYAWSRLTGDLTRDGFSAFNLGPSQRPRFRYSAAFPSPLRRRPRQPGDSLQRGSRRQPIRQGPAGGTDHGACRGRHVLGPGSGVGPFPLEAVQQQGVLPGAVPRTCGLRGGS